MKFLWSFIICLSSVSALYCQTLKVGYEYKHKKADSIVNERGILNIKDSISYFFAENAYLTDSILKVREAEAHGGRYSFKNLPPSDIVYFIKKNLHNQSIVFYSDEFLKDMKYSEPIRFDWKILDEFKECLNMKCQKATTTAYGKKWIVWFTNAIPVPDGPYKFAGLPGLILSIRDQNNDFSFDAVSIQHKEVDLSFITKNNKKYINTTKEKYLKYRREYIKDPYADIRMGMLSAGMKTAIDPNTGKEVDVKKKLDELSKEAQNEYKNDSHIEQ